MRKLDGSVAIVTGAGGGLGRAHALALAARGAAVVVNDVGGSAQGNGADWTVAAAVAEEIVAAGGRAVASTASVASRAGAEGIVTSAVEAFGRVDVVVNNAGILRDRMLRNVTEEDLAATLDVHVKGSLLLSQAAWPVMRSQGSGCLVHTSSAAGLFGNVGQSAYASAKMAIVGLSRTLALEGAPHGITSNVIAPLARTRLSVDALGPLAARLDPAAVSALVVHLACSDVTGEVLSVGGGRVARVLVGVVEGWCSEEAVPTPEDIGKHWEQIMSTARFTVPTSALDEAALLVRALEQVGR